MKTRRPPVFVMWLLDRMEYNPPLAGDLLERYQAGKSRAWFWRQALVAIAIGWARSLRATARSLGPVCAGFAAQAAVVFAFWGAGWPPDHVSVGWRIAMCHVVVACSIAKVLLKKRITGSASVNLRRLLLSELPARQRIVVSRLLAGDTFTGDLVIYCGFVCFFQQPSSFTELMVIEASLLALDFMASSVIIRRIRG